MHKLLNSLLALTALALALLVWAQAPTSKTGRQPGSAKSYQPRLEEDPPVPRPPEAAVRELNTFFKRLRVAAEKSPDSLLLHEHGLKQAEKVFRSTVGVPEKVRLEMHKPFFHVNPEAIFALYHDLPILERGFGLFQQHCSSCHGTYGRGNGSATQQWYTGNHPRNFWYGKFKSRSTKYGAVPTDGDLFRTLTRGLYGSSMPSFRHLSPEDRWALIQFIKTLANFYDDFDEIILNRFDPKSKGPETELLKIEKEPPVTLESVKRGRLLFLKQGCATCHQGNKKRPVGLARWEGPGFDWSDEMNRPISHSRDLTTKVYLSGAASTDLYRIITGGPTVGPMPSYDTIPPKDRWALVHYVQSLFKPDFPQAPPSVEKQVKPFKKGASSKKPSGEKE